jgi:hypothetical protein
MRTLYAGLARKPIFNNQIPVPLWIYQHQRVDNDIKAAPHENNSFELKAA